MNVLSNASKFLITNKLVMVNSKLQKLGIEYLLEVTMMILTELMTG